MSLETHRGLSPVQTWVDPQQNCLPNKGTRPSSANLSSIESRIKALTEDKKLILSTIQDAQIHLSKLKQYENKEDQEVDDLVRNTIDDLTKNLEGYQSELSQNKKELQKLIGEKKYLSKEVLELTDADLNSDSDEKVIPLSLEEEVELGLTALPTTNFSTAANSVTIFVDYQRLKEKK